MEFIDLKKQYQALKKDIDKNIKCVLENSNFIMGNFVKDLEKELADYVGTKYAVTCANGTDALQIALMCYNIKPNDAVFVPSFTFFSTAEVVSILGATPIFVDCDEKTFNMDAEKLEKAIKEVVEEKKLNPRGVIAVDLFGLPADYGKIKEVVKKYGLFLIEDGAQGFGGSIKNKKACSFGDIATTSFFPAKPLGCYGDGGALFTDNEEMHNLILSYRIHGKGEFKYDNVRIGLNSRLDTLQAAVLLPKLKAFREYELEERQKVAKMYSEKLNNYVKVPVIPNNYVSSYAQYTIIFENEEERDYVKDYLHKEDIPTNIYYPKPLHKQTVYKDYDFNLSDLSVSEYLSKRVLSLPMHPYLDEEAVTNICNHIIKALEEFRHE